MDHDCAAAGAREVNLAMALPPLPWPMPELDTPRLRLRKFAQTDLLAVYAWASDPEVARYALWDRHESPVDTQAFLDFCFREYEERGIGPWAVVRKDTAELIGNCSYGRIVPEESKIELAYFFARPHWGHGFATEAVRGAIDYAFGVIGVRRLEARCVAANKASERVMQKAGLEYRGTLRCYLRQRDEMADLTTYALERYQWLGQKR
jgi:ribosomal-protein-alanine N-acetyltransferase